MDKKPISDQKEEGSIMDTAQKMLDLTQVQRELLYAVENGNKD
jgi:hypothetical protein